MRGALREDGRERGGTGGNDACWREQSGSTGDPRRLKGVRGDADCRMALAALYNALLTTCRVMAPFTPFFTEHMYQNLRAVDPTLPESGEGRMGGIRVRAACTGMHTLR